MKRMIAVIVATVLLLSGCQNNTPTDPADSDDSIQFTAEKNAQNKYLLADATSFQETDGFFCGTNLLGNYLQYYDKANGISGVLCADPACAHDSDECGAYIQKGANLSYCDGNLYWIAEDANSRDKYLWKSDLSGMNREKIMQISFEDVIYPYQPQKYVVHQGKLYIMGSADVVDGTQTGKRKSLLSRSLSGDEGFTTVYDEVLPLATEETYRFVDGFIYVSMVTFDDASSTKDLTVTKVDIAKNTSEVIYQQTDTTELLGDFWVTEDHELYLSGSTDEKAYLWKIENGSKKEITFWPVDEVNDPDVMDGIAMLATRDENKIRYVDIRNFSGETIYSGKLFPSAISGLDKDPNTYSFAVLGGDTEKLIINLTKFANMKMVDYTILLDLKDNMKATILWSSEE